MKILHYVSSLNNGGIETMLVNLANLQVKQHDVGIMVFTNNVLESLVQRLDPRIQLIVIGKPVGSKNIYYLFKAGFTYLKFKPEVFHFHDHNAPHLFPLKRKNEKRFATIHNVIPTKWNKTVNYYIAISECVKKGFLMQTGKDNCEVCYNGINLKAFNKKKEYSQKPKKFLSIGRLYPSKGMDIVIRAFALLNDKGIESDVTLDIWGEGQEHLILEKMIENLGLKKRVVLKGNIDSTYVEKHICDYDCVIQASRHEGFGLTAIEAMASGVPTILSNIDGYTEVSKDGEYSLLFTPESPEDMYDKICEMLNHYSVLVDRANKAREYVMQNYAIESLNMKLEDLYNIK